MTIKEAGQTARSALSVFRREPMVLALLLVIVALVGLLYWNAVIAERERQQEMSLIFESRKYEADLLYENRKIVTEALKSCYPAPPPSPPR